MQIRLSFLKYVLLFVIVCWDTLVIGQNNPEHLQIQAGLVRDTIHFNKGWNFHFKNDYRKKNQQHIDLPHTWNAQEVLAQKPLTRTMGIYDKKFTIDSTYRNKRIFLHFYGANSLAFVFINNKLAGKHYGGYTAFTFEVTNFLKYKGENKIEVQVTNAYNPDIAPLNGDFNVYGGIHRPIDLIVTNQNCITPTDYGSSGVFLTPSKVTEKSANLEIDTRLSLNAPTLNFAIKTIIYNQNHKAIREITTPVITDTQVVQNLSVEQPHLWNGVQNPYLYTATVQLLQNEKIVDAVNQPLGFRSYHVHPDSGFYLNGKYLDLHGFGFHEDKAGIASAYLSEDYLNDMALIRNMGANTLRFTHYPHGKAMYDLCDRYGLVVWTEVPFVGGFTNDPAFKAHLTQILKELIRQNYNHPSIMFWGLENEIHIDQDDPLPFLMRLDSLAHQEDPSRLTTIASDIQTSKINKVSDLIAYNRYFGWYGSSFKDLAKWADDTHSSEPNKAFAISEYGGGADIQFHEQNPSSANPDGKQHPEEWQTMLHEASWDILSKRPFVWGKYIWCFADFGSATRHEGHTNGMNDKGLVTYDRKVKKDAYYFYKANWNPSPMIYITERRFVKRKTSNTSIKIFTNLGSAELWVNGKSLGQQQADSLKRIVWPTITLQKGVNKIMVKAKSKSTNKIFADSCEWILE